MATATLDIDTIMLARGAHNPDDGEACLLELVAYVAGEPWSDHPECVCPALGAFGRAWNDALPDELRTTLLKPFITRLIGTQSTPAVQDARAFMAADWAVRVYTPVWLRAAGIDDEAAALEALPALTSTQLCRDAMPIIQQAKVKARAAWAAAGAAARAAARDAAWDAAGDVAWAAAWAVAWAAARAALQPHVELLQTSAADLFDRMISLTEVTS